MVRKPCWNWAALVAALTVASAARAERYNSLDELGGPQTAVIGPAPPADASDLQPDQVIVLQDGGVMRGRVTRDGERFVLARGTGQTFIPASKVLLVAASLEEAYQLRRKSLNPPTADGHLILAEWCLRHDLISNAQREIASACALEPRHARLELLERRLALANERQRAQASIVVRGAPETAPMPVSSTPADTAIGDLTPVAVERFTRKVQPVLVNSCTSAGCHQVGGATKFQLDRAILRGVSNRRTTMNNLAATLALVDRERPRLSPLLTVPRQTHGGMKQPVLGPRREAAFRHLDEWVALVAAQTAQPLPPQTPNESVESDAALGAADFREGQLPAEPAATDAVSPTRYGARLEHWQPRDPFDPEIFNRKYPPRANETAEADAPNSVVTGER